MVCALSSLARVAPAVYGGEMDVTCRQLPMTTLCVCGFVVFVFIFALSQSLITTLSISGKLCRISFNFLLISSFFFSSPLQLLSSPQQASLTSQKERERDAIFIFAQNKESSLPILSNTGEKTAISGHGGFIENHPNFPTPDSHAIGSFKSPHLIIFAFCSSHEEL